MYRKLVISETPHETRVALLEDGTIVELFIEREDDSDVTGNIYKGRVQRVLPGIQAAFVDIGLSQAAFIYVDDVVCHQTKEFDHLIFPDQDCEEEELDLEENEMSTTHLYRQFQIEDLITEGQEIMVQVAKSPMGTKGARVTSSISLPGRFLVLMPTSNHVGISRRIEDPIERSRLKNIVYAFSYCIKSLISAFGPSGIFYYMRPRA
jgi:ribonuclease G